MSFLTGLRRFLAAPTVNKLNMITNGLHRLKTRVVYRPMFGEIGSQTMLGRPLLISNPQFIRLGRRVSIRDGARLEVIDHRPGKSPCLSVGDDTNIEQNVHIVCHHSVRIGANVSITGNCSIVDVTHPYQNIHGGLKIGARLGDDDSFVEIGDGSFIGIGTAILPNVRIGRHAVIGANSVVVGDIPDYCVAAGAPARVIKRFDQTNQTWVSVSGRRDQTEESHGCSAR